MADEDDSPRALYESGHYSLAVTRAWSLVQLRLKQILGNPERGSGDFFVELIDNACRASDDIADWRNDLHRLRMRRNEVDKEGLKATRADAEHAVEVHEGITNLTGDFAAKPRPAVRSSKSSQRKTKMAATPTASDEVIYFQGSPVLRGEIGRAIFAVIAGLIVAAIPFVWAFLAEPGPPMVVTIGFILVGLLIILLPMVFARTVRYRITSYRIDYERGLFSKQFDTLELWHVDDISLHQSMSDRIFGVGTISIVSADRTTPRLQMRGIPDAKRVYDALKDRVIAVKRQRGVIKMDSGSHEANIG